MPGVDPSTWWWRRDWTVDPEPITSEGRLRTSYSRIGTYEDCHLRYFFSNVVGLDDRTSYQMAFGKLMHTIFELAAKGEVADEPTALKTAYRERFDPAWFPSRAIAHQYWRDGMAMLELWHHGEAEQARQALRFEVAFEMEVAGHLVRGRIDRVDPAEGGVILLDYKTARNPAAEDEARRSLQLAIYYLAALRDPELAALGPPVEMQLVYPAQGRMGRFARVSQRPEPDHPELVERRLVPLLEGAAAAAFPRRRAVSASLTATAATASIRRALKDREPTSEQWAAITAPIGPVHVIAGAGSGKTAVMAARIVYLVERVGVAPSEILALTFTNKAATELEERVRDALAISAAAPSPPARPAGREAGEPGAGAWPTTVAPGQLGTGPWPAAQVAVHTYHAFAAELVKAHGVRVGVEPDADLLSEAQQYQILLGLMDGERFEHLHVRTAGAIIRKTLELAAACSDHLVEPAAVADHARRLLAAAEAGERMPDWQVQAARERIELTRLVQRYAEEKRRRSRIDFGDQVARAFELVDCHDDLASELRTRYPHVLLDEYQDTNIAQRRLIQVLCPPGSSIMAVGDARQAIYAFRGATMYNLLSFGEHFKTGDGHGAPRPLPLSTNFRSGRRILELANTVIDPIPEERRGGAPLVARTGAGDGEVRAALLSDQLAEAEFVAEQIVGAHERGLEDGTYPDWRDVAVLVRSKRLLGPLREALERRDVPVEVVGLSGLLETPEIVDLVSVLRVIADPGDNVALARVLLGPRWRIGYRHLVRLARWASRHNWGLKDVLPGEDPDPGDVSFALSEALDHLGEVEGLDGEARARLEAFRVE